MTKIWTRMCLILFVSAFATASHAACAKPKFTKAELTQINPQKINQKTFNSAATKATNYYRCRAGKKPLKTTRGLTSTAASLSKQMAKRSRMYHDSSSQRKGRYRKAGVKTKIYAENIGADARLNYGTTPFIARNATACEYVFQGSKAPIPQHSYASLAMRSVGLWVNSEEHRFNIMHRKVKKIGNGLGYSAKAKGQPCGTYYMTQNFSD